MDDRLTEAQVAAVWTVCGELTAAQLHGLRRHVEQACLLSKRTGWDRKAAAHAEIFGLLAEAAGNPVQTQAPRSSARLAHRLMIAVGPGAADGITANSRKRFLAYLSAGNSEGAAHEMEGNLRVLSFMGGCAVQGPWRLKPAADGGGPGCHPTSDAVRGPGLRRPGEDRDGTDHTTGMIASSPCRLRE
jgi:hypothetical protein